MKRAIAVLMSLFALALAGCSFGSPIEELMKPPQLSEEQSDLYNALISEVGSSIKLKYPRSGSYRSPFVMYDIDGDGISESVVFYESKGANVTESAVEVRIFDSENEAWKSVKSFKCVGTDIDIVDFAIGNDGVNIIVGYYKGLSEKNLMVVKGDSSSEVNTLFESAYTSVFLYDTVKNGPSDLLVFNNNAVSEASAVSLVSPADGAYKEVGRVDMAKDIVSIANIESLRNGETSLLYVDTVNSSNRLSTEIVEVGKNGLIRNLTMSGENANLLVTQRQWGLFSSDIDRDGIIEVPVEASLPGYENTKEAHPFATQWQVYENGRFVRKYYSYCSLNDGYIFTFPERWLGQVTVKTDSLTGDVIFCKSDGSLELMRIRTLKDSSEVQLPNGYKKIASTEHTEYFVKISTAEDALVPTEAEITYGLLLQD